jgi:AcrR family transcriptional regulator
MAKRRYSSPKRQAQAAATREAILDAFVEQISTPGRNELSPTEVARRTGLSLRTVHTHFPNAESQIVGLGEWFDRKLYPSGVVLAADADDLPRYFREIHAMALSSPLSRVLATSSSRVWREVRQQRRKNRLDAIRAAVKGLDAPAHATEDTTAMLLNLSGADAAWPMHDLYGLPLERIPHVIANTVTLLIEQLKSLAAQTKRRSANPLKPTVSRARRARSLREK